MLRNGIAMTGLAVMLATGAAAPAAAAGAPVEVVVTNVKSGAGRVTAQICTAKEFLKPCRIQASAPAVAGTTRIVVPDVPPGRYAAFAYHDANGNGKPDRNFIGIPTEDVGFSNNALKGLSKPKFDVAAFDHGAAKQTLTFQFYHF